MPSSGSDSKAVQFRFSPELVVPAVLPGVINHLKRDPFDHDIGASFELVELMSFFLCQ